MVEIAVMGRKLRAPKRDFALLCIALIIDFVDLIPFNLPGSALVALFLMYLGAPPINSVAKGLMDIVPILEWTPWCTLTVLHMRFGVSFGRLDRVLFSPGTQAPAKTESAPTSAA